MQQPAARVIEDHGGRFGGGGGVSLEVAAQGISAMTVLAIRLAQLNLGGKNGYFFEPLGA